MADINAFSVGLRTEFLKAYPAYDPAKPAPYEAYTARIDSTARIENYAWMSPVPGIQQYQGYRRLANVDAIKYQVTNLEFDAAFEVRNRDIEDDQTGGYKLKAQDLANKAKLYPGRLALKTLALGKSQTCFDGSAFFATSHTIGTGNNLMSYNGSANDASDHNVVFLIHDGPIKPLVYQDRKPAKFMDDTGSPGNSFAKKTRYWVDLEGAGAFGYWWDAIYVDVTDLLDPSEVIDLLYQVQRRFMTFAMPKALASDDTEYTHEQTTLTASNFTIVTSPGLYPILDQLRTQSLVGQKIGGTYPAGVNNPWVGKFNLVASNFLEPGVVAA